jgi:primary replicative DNA helicase (EC 3.6.1.-)
VKSMPEDRERLLPQNIDAEQSVLGALFLDPGAIYKVARFLRPEDFYLEGHRLIYEAMLNLEEEGRPVDLISVTNWLSDQGVLEKSAGPLTWLRWPA